MAKVWVVRADGGAETQNCVDGGFTGIGWSESGDLSDVRSRSDIERLWAEVADPEDGPISRGSAVGNIARFRLEIQAGDWVLTPELNSRYLRVGEVVGDYYFDNPPKDSCSYWHRRKVEWQPESLDRWTLSGRLQDSLKSAITVYAPSYAADLFEAIGHPELAAQSPRPDDAPLAVSSVDAVLERLHEMNPFDFEKLIEHLLAAMGFEETQTTRPTADGGFDVKGTLNASNVIRIEVYGQVKRLSRRSRVGEKAVRELRGVIPIGAQGAFFTTGGYASGAIAAATDQRFVRIGLVDGPRLVELLTQHWSAIPLDFRNELGLELGLVPA